MIEQRKFILAEIAIYFMTHLLNFMFCIAWVCINPDYKRYWTQNNYIVTWVLFGISIAVYCFIIVKHNQKFKKIGLGFIYSIITEILYIIMNISAILRPPYSDEWGLLNIMILVFSFTGLPILFIIIAIVYFAVKRKNKKQKSGE